MNKTVIALVFLIIFKCISIHIHTFPRYNSFSFLIIECIYATLKHPRQQVQCWVMMLTFLLKLLMVRRSVVVFFLGCLFLFCFFSSSEFICKSQSVFFFPLALPSFSTFPPGSWVALCRTHSQVGSTVSAECLCLSLNGLSHLLQKMNMKCLRCRHCRRILGLWAQ